MTGTFTNAGTLALGSRGRLTISGNFTQDPRGTLAVTIGGTPATQLFSQMTLTGSAALAGDFSIGVAAGFAPRAGDRFKVVSYANRTGDFAALHGLVAGRLKVFDEATGDTGIAINSAIDASDLAVTETAFANASG